MTLTKQAVLILLLLTSLSPHAQTQADDVTAQINTCPTACACDMRVTSQRQFLAVDCSNRDLALVPSTISIATEVLSLRGNAITSRGVFELLQKLQHLFEVDLSFNNITTLRPLLLLGDWKVLVHLDVSNNLLDSLPSGALSRMTSLELLLLANNRIASLESGCFAGLRRLRRLSLSGNRIATIGAGTFNDLGGLLTLQLDDNLIDSVSSELLAPMEALENISMSFNRLQRVEDATFVALTRLGRVDLSHNRIVEITPTRVLAPDSPAVVILDGNDLKRLRTDAFGGLSVKDVSVANMLWLRVIEAGAFRDLQRLEILRLHGNKRLCYVHPAAFVDLPRLRILYLHGGNLMAVPEGLIKPLGALEALSLGGNPLHCDCNARWIRDLLGFYDSLEIPGITPASGGKTIIASGKSAVKKSESEKLNAEGLAIKLSELEIIPLHSYEADPTPAYKTETMAKNESGLSFGLTPSRRLILQDVETLLCDSPNDKSLRLVRDIPLTELAPACQPYVLALFNSSVLRPTGGSVTLECRSIGVPTPRVHWLLPSGKLINGTPNSNRMGFDEDGTLTVNMLKPTDYGSYTCVALNPRGYDVASTQLRLYAPGARLLLSVISSTFVAGSWNGTDSTMATVNYVITYRPYIAPPVPARLTTLDISGGETSDVYGRVRLRQFMRGFTVTNLSPDTEYELCLSAEGADGAPVSLDCLRVLTKHAAASVDSTNPLFTAFDVAIATLGSVVVMLLIVSLLAIAFKRFARRSHYEEPRGNGTVSAGNAPTACQIQAVQEVSGNVTGVEGDGVEAGGVEGARKQVGGLAAQIPLRNLFETTTTVAVSPTSMTTSRTSLLGPYAV